MRSETRQQSVVGPRGEKILRLLLKAGTVTTDSLSSELDVSVATVRRDLRELEEHGLLQRTHGGATAIEPLFYETFRHDSSFRAQIEEHAEEKRRIATAAADLIRDGETISLTAGTTTTQVVRRIRHGARVTVVTNTVNVAMELSQRKDLVVIVTGGILRGNWFSLVGSFAAQTMEQMYVDKLFIGVNGIDAEYGLTCHNPDEAAINRIMVEHSGMRIAVADYAKFGAIATHRICPAGAIQLLITDTAAPPAAVAAFRSKGIEVRQV